MFICLYLYTNKYVRIYACICTRLYRKMLATKEFRIMFKFYKRAVMCGVVVLVTVFHIYSKSRSFNMFQNMFHTHMHCTRKVYIYAKQVYKCNSAAYLNIKALRESEINFCINMMNKHQQQYESSSSYIYELAIPIYIYTEYIVHTYVHTLHTYIYINT